MTSLQRQQHLLNNSATFVSSQKNREKLSMTTVYISVSIVDFELNSAYSSENKFKFALTSTTYVINYEEFETGYRVLDDKKLSA